MSSISVLWSLFFVKSSFFSSAVPSVSASVISSVVMFVSRVVCFLSFPDESVSCLLLCFHVKCLGESTVIVSFLYHVVGESYVCVMYFFCLFFVIVS